LLRKVAPPQPFKRHRPATLTARSSSNCRFCRFLHPMKHSAAASTEPGNSGAEFRCRAAVVADVLTVSTVDTGAPDGVTVAGEKLHEAPAGRPVQLKPTAELNPFDGVTVTVAVLLRPAVKVVAVGEVTTEKSGAGRLMVYVAVPVALVVYPLAAAIASRVSVDGTLIGLLYTAEPTVGVVPLVV